MSSLSEDLETCVQCTEAMLLAWSEFAVKYSKENVKLDVSIYRERLMSAFEKFNEISQQVDKIVFCSVGEGSNSVTEPSGSEIAATISPPPRMTEFVDKTVNSPNLIADSSSQSGETSRTPAQLITPNVEIGDQRRTAKHLSPAHFKNEARRFNGRRDTVVSHDGGGKSPADGTGLGAFEDEEVVDLTVDLPLLLEIDEFCSLDAGFARKMNNIMDQKQADPMTDLSASASTARILEGNMTPLSEQLFLSDEEPEDTNRFSNTEVNSQYSSRKSPSASSQPEYMLSPGSQTNTQSFFDLSSRNPRVTLSVPNKAPTNYKNRKFFLPKFGNQEKRAPTYAKGFRRKEPSAITCGLCRETFPTLKSRSDHMSTMHPDIFRTFCRGCGLHLRRFEVNSHYSRCPVYKHESHVDRINGMRLVLNKSARILVSCYDTRHLKRQRQLLAERNDIDIPAVPFRWRVPKTIDSYFEVTSWPNEGEQGNSN